MQGKMNSSLTKSTVKQKIVCSSLMTYYAITENMATKRGETRLQTDQQNLQPSEDWGRYTEDYT